MTGVAVGHGKEVAVAASVVISGAAVHVGANVLVGSSVVATAVQVGATVGGGSMVDSVAAVASDRISTGGVGSGLLPVRIAEATSPTMVTPNTTAVTIKLANH